MAFTCVSQDEALVVFDSSESCNSCSEKLNGMQLGTATLTTAPCPLVAKKATASEYAFVVFDGPESVLYAMRVLTGTSLFGQKIFVEKRTLRSNGAREEQNDADSVAAPTTTSRCVLTGLVSSMFHIDVRDLVEWGARASVVEMKLTNNYGDGTRRCDLTLEGTNSAKRAAAALHGRAVRGGVVACVEQQHQ
jgi:RNA recognition motif-containing protein